MSLQSLKTNAPRLVLLAVLAAGMGVFAFKGGPHALAFENLVAQRDRLADLAGEHPALAPVIFVGTYVTLALFGLVGSTVLNVTAGLLFGFWPGLLWVVFASSLASSSAFLSFRYLFRSFVQARILHRFPRVAVKPERGSLYLTLTLRLLPGIPFSAANLVLAVSSVPFLTYFWVTVVTLLPRHLLYVYTGTHLSDVEDVDDLLSAPLIGALAGLALLPWLLHWLGLRIQRRSQKQPGPRPPAGD